MPSKDFSDLTPEEVLALAIDVEVTNGTRLRTYAELFADYAPEPAALFAEMADEEDQHAKQLETVCIRRFGEVRRTVKQGDVADVVEAHELDDGEHLVFDDLSLVRALEIVLKAETDAEAFYRHASEAATDEELKEMFEQLAAFEDGHVQWVEAKLDELGRSR